MHYVKRFETLGLLTSLAVLSACGAPPRRLADEPRPAPHVPRVSSRAEAQPPVVAVVAFTTTIAPGTNLGGNFDDDGVFRMRESDNRMFVWGHGHECILSDEILLILEQEAGLVALPSPDCWPGVGEPESADALLGATLEDLTLNSFADPGRVDVEVMVAWELFDSAGRSVFRKSAYGFTSLEIGPAVMFGGAVGLAVGESLRRVLADDEFARALGTAR
jgi:hypothetical protein